MVPVANADSEVHKYHVVKLCASCHGENSTPALATVSPRMENPVEKYMATVHGQAYQSGKKIAAACVDCHGHHDILPGFDPQSNVNRYTIYTRCQKCHAGQVGNFLQSIHGKALLNKAPDAPVCTTCHGEHTIIPRRDPNSPTNTAHVAETCARCHAARQISRQYGFSIDRVPTYQQSVHGVKMQSGVLTAANCASCHTNHNVLPASNPQSSIHPANLEKTCGQCHPGPSAYFTSIRVHEDTPPPPPGAAGWIENVYRWGLPLVLGGMLIHNLIVLWYHIRKKMRKRSPLREEGYSWLDFVYHASLFLVLSILALTGFAGRYPLSDLAGLVWGLGVTEAGRALAHRMAGMLLILFLGFYGVRIVLSSGRRNRLMAHLPHPQDVREFMQNLKFYLGLQRESPEIRPVGYVQKIQRWLLIWGFVLMTGTGLFLWISPWLFPLSGMGVQVARVIHFYEAWLMVLGILGWHFFHTMMVPAEAACQEHGNTGTGASSTDR
jgi:cytochrome b subunit of formate dehydrogenase